MAKTMGLVRVGLLEKSQPTRRVAVKAGTYKNALTQERPMIEAVAINSSSRASDILPDTR